MTDHKADKPKISKHNPQQPNLKSVRAFDIVPPHKVRPSDTARPVVASSKPAHTDNTMLPKSRKLLAPSAPADASPPEDAGLMRKTPGVTLTAPLLPAAESTAPASAKPEPAREHVPLQAMSVQEALDQTAAEMGVTVTAPAAATVRPPANAVPQPDATLGAEALSHEVVESDTPAPTKPATTAASPAKPPTGGAPTAYQSEPWYSDQFIAALKDLDTHPPAASNEHPIVAIHKRSWSRLIGRWLLYIIIAAVVLAVALDLAIDAGLLHPISGLPHTTIFHRAKASTM